jgi:hypothetical protein
MAENCEPCKTVHDGDNSNPAGVVDPNTPLGGVNFDIPAIPPAAAPGPADPGQTIDTSPPDYAGGFPRQNLQDYNYLCDQLPTINMMQGLIMNILANHFSNAANIIDPTLRQYTWDPDPAVTKLILNIEEDWDPDVIGRRPAIFLSRQPMTITKLSINDEELGGKLSGVRKFDMLIRGSHSMVCHHMGSAPPDSLAFEAAMLIARVAPILRQWLRLMDFRVTDIGAKEREDDPQDAYKVAVTIPWAFWYPWKIDPVAPVLEFIDMKFFQ